MSAHNSIAICFFLQTQLKGYERVFIPVHDFSHTVLSSFVWGLCLFYCWWILSTMPLRQWKTDWIGRLPAYFSQGHQYPGQGARELKIPPCLIFNQWPLFSGNRKMYNPELLIGLIPLCYSWEGMFCFFIIKQSLISQMLSNHYNSIYEDSYN